ncbi:hypothetical protein ABW19_dt0206628 [Dactylella cylindrospora]|nr:hypothetical protein ABW19_dt0206628 [Dactylella cylindrospora]
MTTSAATSLPRIFVLGCGNIGCLVAHSLRSLRNPPPVTLLLHRQETRYFFQKQGHAIRVERDGIATLVRGFDHELTDRSYLSSLGVFRPEPIRSLIVATKAHYTVTALRSVHDRLNKDSTIVLLQNGMGVVEEINDKIFPNPNERPNMVIGVTSHGAHHAHHFNIIHAGGGKIDLGVIPRDLGNSGVEIPNVPPRLEDFEASTRETLSQLLQCYDLAYSVASYPEILSLQLEKLAINAVINALSVMFDCYNGQLLYSYPISRLMRLIIFEVSKVVAAMPELKQVHTRELRFAPERLERLAVGIAKKTSVNISSMLQDVRAGKMTEVDYINGYVVNKGAELGIPCAVNFMLREMVKARVQIISAHRRKEMPLEEGPGGSPSNA